MRKKFLSALLFGALALSTTVVTSCKDYDDDIQNLQEQIDKLATADQLRSEIATLSASITAAKSDALAEASKALAAAQAAQATADKAATKEEVAALRSSVEAAQAAANKANADLAAAQQNLEALINGKADKADVEAAAAAIIEAKAAAAEAKAAADAAKAAADVADAKAAAAAAEAAEAKAAAAAGTAAAEQAAQAAAEAKAAADAAAAKAEESLAAAKAAKDEALAEVAKSIKEASDLFAGQITDLNGKVTNLESSNTALGAGLEDVQKALDAAVKALEEKIAAAGTPGSSTPGVSSEAVEKAIADLKAELEKAIAEKADNETLAEVAESVENIAGAVERVTALEDFIGKIEEGQDLNGVITGEVAAALTQYATTAYVSGKVEALDARIETLELSQVKPEDLTVLSDAIDALKEEVKKAMEGLVGAYSTMITSIDLFATFHEDIHLGSSVMNSEHTLTFTWIEQLRDGIWPSTDEAKENATIIREDGTKVVKGGVKFEAGKFKTYSDKVIVRVNPIEAELKPEMITLINSQNAAASQIEVVSVERYNGALLTRAADSNMNGLWVIEFKLKDDFDAETFKAETKKSNKDILFAVAAKTEAKADTINERRVVSQYDLTLAQQQGTKAKDFNVTGDEKNFISNIFNRFQYTENDQYAQTLANRADAVWARNDAANGIVTPALEANADNTVDKKDQPYTNPVRYWTSTGDDRFILINDNRSNYGTYKMLPAKVGEDIVIDYTYDSSHSGWFEPNQQVAGFYVTLDITHAVESSPSEKNAWESYEYEGVDTVFTGNIGTIKVLSPKADGDVIGFRVYAVNIDGTLLDPDGRAFYVKLGTETRAKATVVLDGNDFTVVGDKLYPWNNNGYTWTKTGTFDNAEVFDIDEEDSYYAEIECVKKDADNQYPVPVVELLNAKGQRVAYFGSNPNGSSSTTGLFTDLATVEQIRININNIAYYFIDNAEYNYVLKIYKDGSRYDAAARKLLTSVNISFTKDMKDIAKAEPTPDFAYKNAQDKNQWLIPEGQTYQFNNNPRGWNNYYKKAYMQSLADAFNIPVLDLQNNDFGNRHCVAIDNIKYVWNGNAYVTAPWANYGDHFEPMSWQPKNGVNVPAKHFYGYRYVDQRLEVDAQPYLNNNKYYPGLIDNKTEHEISVEFNYGRISKTWNEEYKVYVDWEDYLLPCVKETIVFHSWTDGLKPITSATYNNVVTGQNNVKNPWVDGGNNAIVWDPYNTGDPIASLDLQKVLTVMDYAKVRVNSKYYPEGSIYSNVATLMIQDYLRPVANGEFKLTINDNGVESEYFSATYLDEGKFEIYQNLQKTQAPDASKMALTLEWDLEDCFGNIVHFSVPLTVSVKLQ